MTDKSDCEVVEARLMQSLERLSSALEHLVDEQNLLIEYLRTGKRKKRPEHGSSRSLKTNATNVVEFRLHHD